MLVPAPVDFVQGINKHHCCLGNNLMNKEPTNKMIEKSADQQVKQIRAGIKHESRKASKYSEMLLFSFLTGTLLLLALIVLFDNGVDAWVNNPEAVRVKDMMNVAVYVLPLTFLAFSCKTFIMVKANDALAWLSGGIELLFLKIKSRRVACHSK